jgi:hypothetical protein
MEEHVADELMTLADALLELESLIANHEPSWTGHWQAELANDLALLLKPLDEPNDDGVPERYSTAVRAWHVGDSAEVWHNFQKAVLFLRLQMEEGRLPVYVRDPVDDGQLLPLHPEDWLPWAPKDRLSGDFLETGNYGVRGADGSRFYAQMKHALVYRRNFDAWLIKHLLYSSERSREKEAVKRAIYALWDGHPPQALRAKMRDRQIREWIADHEPEDFRPERYSTATIKRALQQIQQEQLTLLRSRPGN